MDVQTAYNLWSDQYDSNENKTRDLEAVSLRTQLQDLEFNNCLEIGCGTGKNTEWLITKANRMTAVDLSDEMLAKAKSKIPSDKVDFIQADINYKWEFASGPYDLITFSLVLEHIEHLDRIFENVNQFIRPGGIVYIGELHPFKQYMGSKARFETEQGTEVVTCFNHHISDFTDPLLKRGFEIIALKEFFDSDDASQIPRILSLLLRKK